MEDSNLEPKKLHLIKLYLLGYENTGKTTLISSILDLKKTNKYTSTIGIELQTNLIQVLINNKIYNAKIQFYEIGGSPRFRGLITPKVFEKANIILFVYNNNDQKSFDKLKDIYYNCFDNYEDKPLCYIICNKVDIVNDNIEDKKIYELKEEVLEFCEENKLGFLHYIYNM